MSANSHVLLQVTLKSGSNILYWRTTGILMGSKVVKPVLVKNITIEGKQYLSFRFYLPLSSRLPSAISTAVTTALKWLFLALCPLSLPLKCRNRTAKLHSKEKAEKFVYLVNVAVYWRRLAQQTDKKRKKRVFFNAIQKDCGYWLASQQ